MSRYVVVFKSEAAESQIDAYKHDVEKQGGEVHQAYHASFLRGFSATLPATYASQLEQATKDGTHPSIEYIEKDSSVHTK
ncbi:uncharacterized protein MRET_3615 [Malassezia restricta]|uniref:uncharacterized protein n=1 Tax=Malassezia restricta TaxID=76775 RepID=UPI000DD1124D|nr:uncharacterized protein MRET_3615 [Malassezia restricta]AXA51590.1 uncharacterized protein MRET_3615 [Malassezia restricta]